MSISKEQAQKVAALARLKLSAEEEEKYSAELSGVLTYVDQLGNIKGDVESSARVLREQDLRADQQDGGRYQQEIINLAPTKKDNYWSVPAVFGE